MSDPAAHGNHTLVVSASTNHQSQAQIFLQQMEMVLGHSPQIWLTYWQILPITFVLMPPIVLALDMGMN